MFCKIQNLGTMTSSSLKVGVPNCTFAAAPPGKRRRRLKPAQKRTRCSRIILTTARNLYMHSETLKTVGVRRNFNIKLAGGEFLSKLRRPTSRHSTPHLITRTTSPHPPERSSSFNFYPESTEKNPPNFN